MHKHILLAGTVSCLVCSLALAQSAPVKIRIAPEQPLIERRGPEQHLNFDFLLENTGTKALRIVRIELSIYDADNKLELRRMIDENGSPSGISTIPQREFAPGNLLGIFNPFYSFGEETKLIEMRYRFFFAPSDTKLSSPIDYESLAEVSISPQDYRGKTELELPLKMRSIIFDGHDYYAHHRRQDLANPDFQKLGITKNPVRYGYDFCPVNRDGDMYRESPYKKENWYGYGAPLYAPGKGVVVVAVDGVPENEYKGKDVVYAESSDLESSIAGNHLVIDHGNGEFSVLSHMKTGSLRVKKGERVERGQLLGQLGFSGDAFIPHLHYMIMDGVALNSEGLPSYFRNFRRVLGSRVVKVSKDQIDSGDIVEVAK